MRTLLFLIVVAVLFASAFILFIVENRDTEVQRARNLMKQPPDLVEIQPNDRQKRVARAPAPPLSLSRVPLPPSSQDAQTIGDLDISLLPDIPSEIVVKAKDYISSLTRPTVVPIHVTQADNFVNQNQIISLIQEDIPIEESILDDLLSDESLRPNEPITIVRDVDEFIPTSPQEIISEYGSNRRESITVQISGKVQTMTIHDILVKFAQNPDQPIMVPKRLRHFEVTTPEALSISGKTRSYESVRFIRGSYKLQMATIADLIAEQREVEPDTIFYIKTVHPSDVQGLWGIIHGGLVENFASGIGIRQGQAVKSLRVNIPNDADEKIGTKSSFLGRLIHLKAIDSFVYNFKQQRMGQNPNHIYPGQELAIISFQPEELVRIYHYFASKNTG